MFTQTEHDFLERIARALEKIANDQDENLTLINNNIVDLLNNVAAIDDTLHKHLSEIDKSIGLVAKCLPG